MIASEILHSIGLSAAQVHSLGAEQKRTIEARPILANPPTSTPEARLLARSRWLACPVPSPNFPDDPPSGDRLRAQRKRQQAESEKCAAGASEDLRAELRKITTRAARNAPRHGPCELEKEFSRFSANLAWRLCNGASMRGRASIRTKREGYRQSGSVPKWWGDMAGQVASEIESALWEKVGVFLDRYSRLYRVSASADSLILQAMRRKVVVVYSLRAGERILRRMSHREADAETTLARLADSPATESRWLPLAERVGELRAAIVRGARNAPTAQRFIALFDSIMSGKIPTGSHASHSIGRMLSAAAAGGFAEPQSWRAYSGARLSPGRPATATV